MADKIQIELFINIAIAMALFYAARRFLGLKVSEIFSGVIKELRELISLKPTMGAINAITVVSMIIVIIAYISSKSFSAFLDRFTGQTAAVDVQVGMLVLVGMCVVGIVMLGSIWIVGKFK